MKVSLLFLGLARAIDPLDDYNSGTGIFDLFADEFDHHAVGNRFGVAVADELQLPAVEDDLDISVSSNDYKHPRKRSLEEQPAREEAGVFPLEVDMGNRDVYDITEIWFADPGHSIEDDEFFSESPNAHEFQAKDELVPIFPAFKATAISVAPSPPYLMSDEEFHRLIDAAYTGEPLAQDSHQGGGSFDAVEDYPRIFKRKRLSIRVPNLAEKF